MEGLDLTLKLGLPRSDQFVGSNKVPTIGQGNKEGESSNMFVDGTNNEGAISNMDVNLRVSNYLMRRFSGAGNNFFGGSSGQVNHHPVPVPPPAPLIGSEFVIIDVPARRALRERALANANPNANAMGGYNFIGPLVKRCTNLKCNTFDTPMWRRGPLGPKTLCNACGIKYRKEEERKKAREAARNRDNNNNNQIYYNFVD